MIAYFFCVIILNSVKLIQTNKKQTINKNVIVTINLILILSIWFLYTYFYFDNKHFGRNINIIRICSKNTIIDNKINLVIAFHNIFDQKKNFNLRIYFSWIKVLFCEKFYDGIKIKKIFIY